MGERQAWPADGLERVTQCPVCSKAERWLQYERLIDRLPPQAPGEWRLWRCGNCRCAFLDPRPTAGTIGLAYRNYYTHQKVPSSPEPIGRLGVLRRSLANGYRNWRFGSNLRPATRLGALLFRLMPASVRAEVDLALRYLPKMIGPRPYRVLDVGCGSGGFLREAAWAGWRAHGCDFDPEAVEKAKGDGIDVRVGGIEAWRGFLDYFDAITFSHVIEHMHDPMQTLRQARTLLRLGGSIYLETPNIDAPLHDHYGSDWRGLEPPRHLVLFTRAALQNALRRAGFAEIVSQHRPDPSSFLISESERLANESGREPTKAPVNAASGEQEFITLTAIAV